MLSALLELYVYDSVYAGEALLVSQKVYKTPS